MDFVATQRFGALRKQLDTLHYSQPFNVESTALVERLLNELMKTTEAFQTIKNENAVLAQEASLNTQSLLPLQKENERLVKENNDLHFQIIKRKEDADQADLKWKGVLRQSQNESQDLRFLTTQKDSVISQMQNENAKLRQKLERVMEKLYLPSQDQIVGGLTSTGQVHNVLRGSQQQFEVSQNLGENNALNDMGGAGDEEGESPSPERRFIGGGGNLRDQEWAQELRKSDERQHEIRVKYEGLVQAHVGLEEKCKKLETGVEARDNEIIRLGGLYQGGQNLEKLNLKFHQETNEKIVVKLQNQVTFLNKENHRIQTQIDLFTGDRTAVDQIDQYRKELDDVAFENQTLRKDLRQLTSTLKDFQESEFRHKQEHRARKQVEDDQRSDLDAKMKQVENEQVKTVQEKKRADALRAAFNADKKALHERNQQLEKSLKQKDDLYRELERRLSLAGENDNQQRGELNYWNGKVANMKRDLDFQQTFSEKLVSDNKNLQKDIDNLKRHLEMKDKDQSLLKRQIGGLQEDNERIARMYQLVNSSPASSTPVKNDPVPTAKKVEEELSGGKKCHKCKDESLNTTFQNGTFGSPGSASRTMKNENNALVGNRVITMKRQ